MQNYDSTPTEWPGELAWVFEYLRPTKFQKFKTFRMDSGHERRRPVHSPIAGLTGQVTMTEAQLELLRSLSNQIRSYTMESRKLRVSFYGQPAVLSTSITFDDNSRPSTHVVQIDRVNHSDLTKRRSGEGARVSLVAPA